MFEQIPDIEYKTYAKTFLFLVGGLIKFDQVQGFNEHIQDIQLLFRKNGLRVRRGIEYPFGTYKNDRYSVQVNSTSILIAISGKDLRDMDELKDLFSLCEEILSLLKVEQYDILWRRDDRYDFKPEIDLSEMKEEACRTIYSSEFLDNNCHFELTEDNVRICAEQEISSSKAIKAIILTITVFDARNQKSGQLYSRVSELNSYSYRLWQWAINDQVRKVMEGGKQYEQYTYM